MKTDSKAVKVVCQVGCLVVIAMTGVATLITTWNPDVLYGMKVWAVVCFVVIGIAELYCIKKIEES